MLRDDRGWFVCGFASGLGGGSIIEAELWTILVGLQLVKNRGCEKVNVLTDSTDVVRLILTDCSSLHPCFNLVCDIKKLMGVEGHIILTHTFREANLVADGFAKHGLGMSTGCIIFENIPSFVAAALSADDAGVIPRGQ